MGLGDLLSDEELESHLKSAKGHYCRENTNYFDVLNYCTEQITQALYAINSCKNNPYFLEKCLNQIHFLNGVNSMINYLYSEKRGDFAAFGNFELPGDRNQCEVFLEKLGLSFKYDSPVKKFRELSNCYLQNQTKINP